jgi:alpha-tubulin suppressor-like RCC1 family protein
MTKLYALALVVGGSGCHLLIPDGGPSSQSKLPSATAVQLALGSEHSCALTSEGGVRCWGANRQGQLGAGTDDEIDPDGDRYGRYLAMQVVGLETGVAAISTFADTTCALTTAGGVKCWGEGEGGALGNGAEDMSAVPVDVIGLDRGVTAISVGYLHACAMIDTGGVKCWGDNSDGQLGDGTTESRDEPVDVIGLDPGVVEVSAGGGQTCALTSAGAVSCWGNNTWGECGSDDFYWTLTSPTPVTGLSSGIASVVAGSLHTCALTTAGGVKCWGGNETGQLGNDAAGSFEQRDEPVDVIGLSAGVDAIHPSGWYSMARIGDAVKQWGAFDRITVETTPIDSVASSGVTQLATGNLHACYIDPDGGVMCWGDNVSGAVGYWDPDLGEHPEPEPIPVDSLP